MLDSLRNAASSWVAKVLLGLLVVSFAVWGISGQGVSTPGGGKVISAGNTSVTALDYRLAFDQRLAALSRQFGTNLTRAQATSLGVEDMVISELMTGALLDETARKLGLGVSQEKIAELAAADPTFQDFGGRFDVNRFDYVLQQIGMTRDQYLQNRAQASRRQQIIDAVTSDVKAPDMLLENTALYRGEDRTIDYIVLPRSLVEPIEDPEASVLLDWFEDNIEAYAAPEYRNFDYAKLEPADIANPQDVSQEEINAYYEQNKAGFTVAEKRTIEQLNFPNREVADAARESMRSGVTFEGLVELQGKKLEDVAMGTMTKAQVADEAIANAAFALGENQVSDIIDGAFGPVLVRVTKIEPEQVTALAQVEDELRTQLSLADAGRRMQEIYDGYEDARAAGDTLREAAEKQGLKVVTLKQVTVSGDDDKGNPIPGIPYMQQLLSAVFDAEEEVETRPLTIGANGYLFYEVSEVVPARIRTLDEVRDEVVADWRDAEAEHRLTARAKDYIAAIEKGETTFEKIAEELGLEKTTKRGLKRQASDVDLGTAGVNAVFNVVKGAVNSVPNPAGDGEFLFHVTEVFQPAGVSADALPDSVKEAASQALVEDLLSQLTTQLQSEIPVSVNRSVAQQAMLY